MPTVIARRRVRFTMAPRHEFDRACNVPGELLTMDDGTEWFHPHGGEAPVLITDQNRSGLS
jgi:hypothetical protein